MIGAIAGDVIGSVHEGWLPQDKSFRLLVDESTFTDDTVLTVAIASALRERSDYAAALRRWGRRYPDARYGGRFIDWLFADDAGPYHSFGNGSAMRVSPVGWALDDLDEVISEARRTAEVTHDHPEGIRGAEATAAAVFVARTTHDRQAVLEVLGGRFGYDCTARLAHYQARGVFDVRCQTTVPAAAVAFAHSTDFEDAVRNAVSFGGDTDTVACIAGALAEACYGGVPAAIQSEVLARLDGALRDEVLACAAVFGPGVKAARPGDGR